MSALRSAILWLSKHASRTYPTWVLWVIVSVTLTAPIGIFVMIWSIVVDMAGAAKRTAKYEWSGLADYYSDVSEVLTLKKWRESRERLLMEKDK